eukprot:symbB.v1.2.030938.t1/scaffold3540.1/size54394/1
MLFRLLVLTMAAMAGLTLSEVVFEELDREYLVSKACAAGELQELFGLLRCSHYKTRPSDLRCFVDTPNIRWFVLRSDSNFVGLGIAGIEDKIPDDIAEAIYLRQQKVPPQLVAQTLSSEAGFREATNFRFARVMRLCVHPAAQRRGFGQKLLDEMLHCLRQDVDETPGK